MGIQTQTIRLKDTFLISMLVWKPKHTRKSKCQLETRINILVCKFLAAFSMLTNIYNIHKYTHTQIPIHYFFYVNITMYHIQLYYFIFDFHIFSKVYAFVKYQLIYLIGIWDDFCLYIPTYIHMYIKTKKSSILSIHQKSYVDQ